MSRRQRLKNSVSLTFVPAGDGRGGIWISLKLLHVSFQRPMSAESWRRLTGSPDRSRILHAGPKKSCLMAKGTGLVVSPDEFDVSFPPHEEPKPVVTDSAEA
jgi:hypothetical protein